MNIQAIPPVGSHNSAGIAQTVSAAPNGFIPPERPLALPAPPVNEPAARGHTLALSSSGTPDNLLDDALYDVQDLNKNGMISSYEEYIYSLTHFIEPTLKNQPMQYDAQGTLQTLGNQTPHLINIFA